MINKASQSVLGRLLILPELADCLIWTGSFGSGDTYVAYVKDPPS